MNLKNIGNSFSEQSNISATVWWQVCLKDAKRPLSIFLSCVMFIFVCLHFFRGGCCIFDCVCARLQPVRSYQSAVVVHGGVTKLGSEGPQGFRAASSRWVVTHVLWQGNCIMVYLGMACCGCGGLTGQGSVGTSLLMLPEVDAAH